MTTHHTDPRWCPRCDGRLDATGDIERAEAACRSARHDDRDSLLAAQHHLLQVLDQRPDDAFLWAEWGRWDAMVGLPGEAPPPGEQYFEKVRRETLARLARWRDSLADAVVEVRLDNKVDLLVAGAEAAGPHGLDSRALDSLLDGIEVAQVRARAMRRGLVVSGVERAGDGWPPRVITWHVDYAPNVDPDYVRPESGDS